MKLITEYNDLGVQCLMEGAGVDRQHYLSGIFMQAEKQNRNGRIYTKRILGAALEKYITEQVNKGRAVGELNHPEGPSINLDKVSHRIVSLKWNGDNVMGKALILNTPMGNIVKGLMEGGVQLGVSSRGMGSLERVNGVMSVKSDFVLSTIDIVQDPSAPDAFVNGIMEGVEYFVKGNEIIAQKTVDAIKRTSSAQLAEAQAKLFQNFLIEVSNKMILT